MAGRQRHRKTDTHGTGTKAKEERLRSRRPGQQTDRQSDTEADIGHRQIQTDEYRDSERGSETDKQSDPQVSGGTKRQTEEKRDRVEDTQRQTEGHRNRHIDRQEGGRAQRQPETFRGRQRNIEADREAET